MLIKGNSSSNSLTGTAAVDQIYGFGGDDALSGGVGNDLLIGDAVFTGPITRVSTDSNGSQLPIGSNATTPVFSPDGTKLGFLANDPVTGLQSIFIKDLLTGTLTEAATPIALNSQFSFSPDGTKIAFSTLQSLVPADNNNFGEDVYVKDLTTGAYTLVSANAAGIVANNFYSSKPQFSPDGTKVLFESNADNLVPGDTNGVRDIFLKDLSTGAVTRVSVGTLDEQGTASSAATPQGSLNAVFSPDGTEIAFQSDDNGLTGDTPHSNAFPQVYVKNLLNNILNLESQFIAGNPNTVGNGDSINPHFSPDGSQVVFASAATNFPGGNPTSKHQIYIKDMVHSSLALASLFVVNNVATFANHDSYDPVFSPDGHFILFSSDATNFTANDTNGTTTDVLIESLSSVQVVDLSQNASGVEGDSVSGATTGAALQAVFSPDGSMVAYLSAADNLVSGDTNFESDIFVATLGLAPFNLQAPPSAGNDLLDGGPGADVMAGGPGNDTYYVENAGDVVIESQGAGSDSVIAFVTYTLPANVEAIYTLAGGGATGNGGDNLLDGAYAGSGQTLDGQGGNDVIYGTFFNDTLIGGAGSDALYDIGGNDTMQGGSGDDAYFVNSAADAVQENAGEGSDTIYASVNFTLPANVEILEPYGSATRGDGNDDANVLLGVAASQGLTLDGHGGNDVIYGSNFDDTLIGGAGDDLLWGFGGNDTMQGGTGNDTYIVEQAGDVVQENPGEGNDTVYASVNFTLPANVENLFVYGGATSGNGNSGDNLIVNEFITTGVTLTGGGGNDTFVFIPGTANFTTITDFDGNGAGVGDVLEFAGYGISPTFTSIDASHWEVNYNNNTAHDFIDFSNVPSIDVAHDVLFV